jgi:hypothetical protein
MVEEGMTVCLNGFLDYYLVKIKIFINGEILHFAAEETS